MDCQHKRQRKRTGKGYSLGEQILVIQFKCGQPNSLVDIFLMHFYMCLCLICLGELSTGQRESKPEKKFLWWANPGDPIQLRAIQFIQMTVIQSWLEAIQAALGPRITRGHPRIVIRLPPLILSLSSFVFEFAFEFVSVFLLVFVFWSAALWRKIYVEQIVTSWPLF